MTKGDRLKMRLEDVGMTQSELARKVGVSGSTVSQWLKGSTLNLKNDNMLIVLRELFTTEEWLVHGKDRACDARGRRLDLPTPYPPEILALAEKFLALPAHVRAHLEAVIEDLSGL